ncbi:MAG TPA: ribonuclease D [Steroidobacteraceae bacterium]|nr:ribonuclease D [Steroidobacteraceae bacterium]
MHNARGFYRSSFVLLQHIADTADAVTDLAARLAPHASIGLDTEFLRERTYRAELCLLQVSAGDDAICVDPIAVTDLGALAGPLTGAGVVKVMHASRQDLEVLLPAVGLVRPVFDTQIAAALAGFAAQIGYAELARRLLGVELPKAHTRTDWSRRPLSSEQIEYALDDVRHLVPLKLRLEEQLEKLGRMGWLAEELAGLDDARALVTDPEEAWRRIKGLRGLDPARARLARGLAAWRERRAIERNRPRGWILDDGVLREVIVRVPRTLTALEAIAEIPAGVVRHSGAELLACVAAANVPDPAPALDMRQRPDPAKSALVKKLGAVNQAVATELGVNPEVLATRRDLERLADGGDDIAALRGWRRSVVGEKLLGAM